MKALKVYVSAYHNEVTGSRFLVTVERPDDVTYRILVDYGYFQEPKYRYLNYVDDLNPENIDCFPKSKIYGRTYRLLYYYRDGGTIDFDKIKNVIK